MVCSTCGSDKVFRDATAAWCVETQQWEMVTVFDHSDCEQCNGECSLTEKEVDDFVPDMIGFVELVAAGNTEVDRLEEMANALTYRARYGGSHVQSNQ